MDKVDFYNLELSLTYNYKFILNCNFMYGTLFLYNIILPVPFPFSFWNG